MKKRILKTIVATCMTAMMFVGCASNNATNEDKTISPQNAYMYENFNPYASKSSSFTNQKQYGNFTLGTKYDGKYSPESMTQTSTLFSK